MPEKGYGRVGPFVFDHFRQQGEVIVLDEDQRAFFRQFLQDTVGEFLIDLFIHLPVGLPEYRPGVGNMAERPQPFIGKTVVITFLLRFVQPDPFENVAVVLRGHP